MKSVLLITGLLIFALARNGFGPSEQEWGYVTVREGAHMFWWLHKTSADVQNYTDRPLVIWLQGGPGISSTGYGNFAELGPLDIDLNPRNSTWINYVNVLFVDSPVGTGYSYTDSKDAPATNNTQIADDFLVFFKEIYEIFPELKQVPLYIFSQSYGGKMAVEIALVLDQAIKDGEVEANFVGVALGGPWISPIDIISNWAPFLYNLGFIDRNGYEQVQASVKATKTAFDNGKFLKATIKWRKTQNLIDELTNKIDFYNVLTEISVSSESKFKNEDIKISKFMNGKVKEALGLNHTWVLQSSNVFVALANDFMKPVTDIVETLLNTTSIKVAVYNGQLDLIVATPGTVKWVDELKFTNSNLWKKADRKPIIVDDVTEGYYKKLGNLAMYWIYRAGHEVPADNPAAMQFILEDVTNNFSTEASNETEIENEVL